MFAVIQSGGKQYRVTHGQKVRLEKLPVEAGKSIELDQVLMVTDGDDVKIGAPFIDGMKVTAEVVSHGRGEKIRIIKFRRRKNSMRTNGHRQDYTEIKIIAIAGKKAEPKVGTEETETKTAKAKKAAKAKAATKSKAKTKVTAASKAADKAKAKATSKAKPKKAAAKTE